MHLLEILGVCQGLWEFHKLSQLGHLLGTFTGLVRAPVRDFLGVSQGTSKSGHLLGTFRGKLGFL